MTRRERAHRFEVQRRLPGGTLTLRGEELGRGRPIVLLHGLSATRRQVVQGSRHLARRGYRLVGYDARGHGASDPAPGGAGYDYVELVADLEALLEQLHLERPVLVGSSMGAATAMAFALRHTERVPALVQITPAYEGGSRTGPADDGAWERLAGALERDGVDGFVAVAQPEGLPERWRRASVEATRQRMERHQHVEAVAEALRAVPRSTAWEGLEPLERLEVPTLVVASRDEADALHPLRVAEAYVERLPDAELVVESEDESPLAWRGARLSQVIGDWLERRGLGPHS